MLCLAIIVGVAPVVTESIADMGDQVLGFSAKRHWRLRKCLRQLRPRANLFIDEFAQDIDDGNVGGLAGLSGAVLGLLALREALLWRC